MRLRQGLAVISTDDRLMIVGGPKRHTFRGKSASDAFATLLRLLDGTRDEDTLAAESGLPPDHLRQALALLNARALLDESDGPVEGDGSAISRPAIPYLARQISPRSGYPTTSDLLGVLSVAAVHVVGERDLGELVCADLIDSGVGLVTTGPDLPDGMPTLVVALDAGGAPKALERALSWCAPRGIRVLRASAHERHAEVGPCFTGTHPVCPECLRRSRAAVSWAATPAKNPEVRALLAGMAASQTLATLARLTATALPPIVTRISLDEGTSQTHLLLPYQDCVVCSSGLPHVDQETELVDAYELVEIEQPAHISPLKELTQVELDVLRKLESQRLNFPTQPRTPLSEGPMADLMRKVAGFRDQAAHQRWAPTGGNLASVELYVVTGGLGAHTVYRYDDLNDELIAVHPDPITPREAVAGTDLAADAAAVFVFVAGRGRIANKYRDFAYRLSHLDAGCATTQFAAVAAGHGLTVAFASEWDERLLQLLSLDGDDQFVTAVAAIRNAGGASCP